MRSKLPLRVRGVELEVRAPSGARDCDRNSRLSEWRLRAPSIPMSGHTCQLLGRERKPALAQQKRLRRLVLNSFNSAQQ